MALIVWNYFDVLKAMLNMIFPSLSWTYKLKQTDWDLTSVLLNLTWRSCSFLAVWVYRFRTYLLCTVWFSKSCMICNKFRKKHSAEKLLIVAVGRLFHLMEGQISNWTGSCAGNVTPQQSFGEKIVNSSTPRNFCMSQKHFRICKERMSRPLDHK